MKVTKEKSAENRAALVETAARLFRERGIDGVGVAEIGKAAGLTHERCMGNSRRSRLWLRRLWRMGWPPARPT
jgi:hypothetical protein